jgi:UDP-N-acetylglucosamine enolpyruvyl transferase
MALATDGISEIYDPELIQRGYSDIASKLNALGAEVEFFKGDT